MRIVSCVPSLSELLCYLDEKQIVGRTKFCISPQSLKKIPTIGGTKNLEVSKIIGLNADLVIAAREENIKDQIEEIGMTIPVVTFNIKTVDDALNAIEYIGAILGKEIRARSLIDSIKMERLNFKKKNLPDAVYMIWKDPMMTVGRDTFIHNMMVECGFVNLFSQSERYPIIDSIEDLRLLKPAFLLLSSEPFPFKQIDIDYFSTQLPNAKVIKIDGTYFSWYGSRLKDSYRYFTEIIRKHNIDV